MAYTIPDKGTGENNIQSIMFKEDIDILVDGINGINCVLSGLAVTGGADMTPAVAKGAVLSNGVLYAVAAADVTIDTADATHPRIDLIVVNSSGALAVRKGTAAAAPKPPVRTANDVVIASVFIGANDGSIGAAQIYDRRVMREWGPIVVKRDTTATTFSNTAAIQTYFTITLPSGLFLAGHILRVRLGGHYTLNSGTPTLTVTIAYGGTTMFADVTATGAADADEGAWFVDLDLVAQGNSEQALQGFVTLHPAPAVKTAPTTGIAGDIGYTAGGTSDPLLSPIQGNAAVNSDTGDRTFTVQWTMSVANAANTMTVEHAYAELL